MPEDILMPKLGLTMTRGTVVKWLKKERDPAKQDEAICQVETEKTVSDVGAPSDGYLIKILINEGVEQAVLKPIAVFGSKADLDSYKEGSGAGAAAPAAKADSSAAVSSADKKPQPAGASVNVSSFARNVAEANNVDLSTVVGTGPNGRIMREDVLAVAGKTPKAGGAKVNVKVSPLARNVAEANNIDLSTVVGTGPDGRIMKEDVLAMIGKKAPAAKREEAVAIAAPDVNERKEPISGIRAVVARRLSESKRTIPHVYFKVAVNATEILKLKQKLAQKVEAKTKRKLTVNDIIVYGVAKALEEFKGINICLIDDQIIHHNDVNVGVAVNSPRGLVVPVIKNANTLSLSEINAKTGELIEKAKDGKLALDEMQGGSLTVSNLGASRIDEFVAIINPPESVILAIARAEERPCVENGAVVARPIMNVWMSADHRIIDGALAAQFMERVRELLENPYLMML